MCELFLLDMRFLEEHTSGHLGDIKDSSSSGTIQTEVPPDSGSLLRRRKPSQNKTIQI